MTFMAYIVGQFGKPQGVLGWMAGRIMSSRPSNRARNRWTVSLMNLTPVMRVLEIGHGPGLALLDAANAVTDGLAVGLDHSTVMHAQAKTNCKDAIASGRANLVIGDVTAMSDVELHSLGGPFDRIYAVNVAFFWNDLVKTLSRLRTILKDDGKIMITHQPRNGEKSDAQALRAADKLSQAMLDAGFRSTHVHKLETLSPIAVCVEGRVA